MKHRTLSKHAKGCIVPSYYIDEPVPQFKGGFCPLCKTSHYWAILEANRQARIELFGLGDYDSPKEK